MSGPIVRKYGFPNFDKIFGERDVQHGAEQPVEPLRPDPQGTGLPPDVSHHPVDANRPDSSGQMAPATEFGNAAE
jgi:hypothetical protein